MVDDIQQSPRQSIACAAAAMSRLGSTVSSTPSTSGRAGGALSCSEVRERLGHLPATLSPSLPARQRVGTRTGASLRCSRQHDGHSRRPWPPSAAVANAAAVFELELLDDPVQQDVVPSMALTQQQISTADAQRAIERLRVATHELRRNMGEDRWTGFTVSLGPLFSRLLTAGAIWAAPEMHGRPPARRCHPMQAQ